MLRISAFILTVFLIACHISTAFTQHLSYLETDDLRLVYLAPMQSNLAPYVAQCLENSIGYHEKLFHYTPSDKMSVVLWDSSDAGNASAGAVPRNYLSVEIEPISYAFETVPGNERLNTLANHEMVHITTQDMAAARDLFFRKAFGGKVSPSSDHPESIGYFFLTTPRAAAPRWYLEGIAVFLETWMAGGIGRAQGAWDEMVFRSMVRDGSRFYDPLGLVSEGAQVDFQVGVNHYLYGTRFLSYLAYRYSPESLLEWTRRDDGSKGYYSSQFHKVFGKKLEDVWRDWVAWEHDFQTSNLEAIRKFPVTSYKDISTQALGSVSRAFYDPEAKTLYAAVHYPGIVAHVGAISNPGGSVEKIKDIKDPVLFTVTSLAYDPSDKTLFYTTDNHARRDIRSIDLATRKSRTILKDVRIGDLAFNRADRSLWGIRHFNGITTVVRIPYPYKEWHQVYSWPYGNVAYDIDVSPDGELLSASLAEENGNQTLRIMKTSSLLAGDHTPMASVEFGSSIPSNFVFSPDGKYLFGSSYYTGVSNIFRYEIATKALEAVSNTETGFFRPIPLDDGSLMVFRYTGEGFVPAVIEGKPVKDAGAIVFFGQQIAEKYPIVKQWQAPSPASVPIESKIISRGTYRPLFSLKPENLYPVVEGYKDYGAVGFHLNLSDPLFMNVGSVTATYTPDASLKASERTHLKFRYQRFDWSVNVKYNAADFYDLFGPTKTSRKGYSFGLGYDKLLIYDKPRNMNLSFDATYYGGLDRLPDYQNVTAIYDRLFRARAKLEYSNLRSSLGYVDDEKGQQFQIVAQNNYVNGDALPQIRGSYDIGFALPVRHSSIWLRTSGGRAFGDRENPFANYFFGGYGNNWVDHGSEKRYRDYYSFPGVRLNELGGKDYAKAMIEWNLPPIRFHNAGTPGFYASWLRPALFTSALVTNAGNPDFRKTVRNIGSQIDFRFGLLSKLEMTLSMGYAYAFGYSQHKHDEFMVSLKILN
jgi:hypothetical protein